jgi:hypothetical protein
LENGVGCLLVEAMMRYVMSMQFDSAELREMRKAPGTII